MTYTGLDIILGILVTAACLAVIARAAAAVAVQARPFAAHTGRHQLRHASLQAGAPDGTGSTAAPPSAAPLEPVPLDGTRADMALSDWGDFRLHELRRDGTAMRLLPPARIPADRAAHFARREAGEI